IVIYRYVERMTNENIHHAIIVVQESITPLGKQGIAEAHGDFHLEQFLDSELLVNVTRHVLVPRHFPMTDEQKRALLEKYKVKETQLPRIQIGDPIAHYFGLRRGQVVKIVRPSETAGRYVTYRFCV
ncbi:MAG: DNA-directed RNA polymerases I, II, and III subunit RPABC2, partial [Streblomastix strix]